MSTQVAVPGQFQDILRTKVLAAFVDLVPTEQIDKLIEAEVKHFFQDAELVVLEPTTIVSDNPNYNQHYWGSTKTIETQKLAFTSRMTPFRQLVWKTLNEALEPKLKSLITESDSILKSELDAWIQEQATPQINTTGKALFTQLSLHMSSMLLRNTLATAIKTSHEDLMNGLRLAGVDTSQVHLWQPPVPDDYGH